MRRASLQCLSATQENQRETLLQGVAVGDVGCVGFAGCGRTGTEAGAKNTGLDGLVAKRADGTLAQYVADNACKEKL